jgi:hypothetical protein
LSPKIRNISAVHWPIPGVSIKAATTSSLADTGDDLLLFFDRNALSYGGSDFGFLADAWRRWPQHFILLVTDGDGAIPLALPGNKARTAVILIPPDCDAALLSQIADRVVTLNDLRGLANVLTMLLPRTRVA